MRAASLTLGQALWTFVARGPLGLASISNSTFSPPVRRSKSSDDVTTTGGTLIAGADALMQQGAERVFVFVTHALLSAEGLERLANANFAGIVVTDTVPVDPLNKPDNMTVLTVAPLLAETIMNVFADDSVSAIFGGENQLF